MAFIGRLLPLLIHFPIALVLAAAGEEGAAAIEADPESPAFVLHTGDLTHLSKAAEFDTLQQVLSELSVPVFYVPGEHDDPVHEVQVMAVSVEFTAPRAGRCGAR